MVVSSKISLAEVEATGKITYEAVVKQTIGVLLDIRKQSGWL